MKQSVLLLDSSREANFWYDGGRLLEVGYTRKFVKQPSNETIFAHYDIILVLVWS